jgi:hypothetical protein
VKVRAYSPNQPPRGERSSTLKIIYIFLAPGIYIYIFLAPEESSFAVLWCNALL